MTTTPVNRTNYQYSLLLNEEQTKQAAEANQLDIVSSQQQIQLDPTYEELQKLLAEKDKQLQVAQTTLLAKDTAIQGKDKTIQSLVGMQERIANENQQMANQNAEKDAEIAQLQTKMRKYVVFTLGSIIGKKSVEEINAALIDFKKRGYNPYNPDSRPEGTSKILAPIHRAFESSRYDIAIFLIEKGFDVNFRCEAGAGKIMFEAIPIELAFIHLLSEGGPKNPKQLEILANLTGMIMAGLKPEAWKNINTKKLKEALDIPDDSFLFFWQAKEENEQQKKFKALIKMVNDHFEAIEQMKKILPHPVTQIVNGYLTIPQNKDYLPNQK